MKNLMLMNYLILEIICLNKISLSILSFNYISLLALYYIVLTHQEIYPFQSRSLQSYYVLINYI